MAKLVICPSGKARPIESASTTGRPVTPATMSERSPLAPPISPDMTARNGAEMLLHGAQRPGGELRIGQALLPDQRRADAGDHGDEVVVGKVLRIHQRDARAVVVEAAEVDIGEIGIAAAAGAQDPGAGRQRFELVAPDLAHHQTSADIVRVDPLKGWSAGPRAAWPMDQHCGHTRRSAPQAEAASSDDQRFSPALRQRKPPGPMPAWMTSWRSNGEPAATAGPNQ